MSKSKITKNLRFEIGGKIYTEFWDIGINLFNLRTKNQILIKLLKVARKHYKG